MNASQHRTDDRSGLLTQHQHGGDNPEGKLLTAFPALQNILLSDEEMPPE